MLQVRATAPANTVARLFEIGVLNLEDEAALNELQTIQNGFQRWVSPGKGWLSSGDGNSVPSMPRALGQTAIWRRYSRWHGLWSKRVLPASPSRPWGLTAAGLVVALGTTAMTFEQAAQLIGWQVSSVEALFVRALKAYPQGAILVAAPPDLREQAPDAPELTAESPSGEGPLPM